jgi:hypothetical protein
MNTLMLIALAVVAFCYCGGKYCPKILSSNKEMLLGVLVGMALCSFAGLRLEGLMVPDCDKILNKIGGDHIDENQGFAPSSCRGYRRGGEQVDTTGDSEWCNKLTNPGDYCADKPQLSELPKTCCTTDANTEECKRFNPGQGNNWTLTDLINRCSEISP